MDVVTADPEVERHWIELPGLGVEGVEELGVEGQDMEERGVRVKKYS